MIEVAEVAEEQKREVSELRWLTDTYQQAQKMRIATENRLRALQQGADEADAKQVAFLENLIESSQATEDLVLARMRKAVKSSPIWPWLSGVKGIGPTLATKILGLIPGIESFDTVSKLWRFAGLAVIDGQRERPVKGERIHYNIRLKTVMYLVGGSFLKTSSPYRRIYDDARVYYEANRSEWTKAHCHMAALRKMEKVFMSHLWEEWRQAEGLPTRALYVHEKLGHTTVFRKEDFR